MDKVCIIVQGQTKYVKELKMSFNGYDIIWSTWKGEENNYDQNDIVLFNDYPSESGVANLAYQQLSTLNGLKEAKKLGYTHALKWRSDQIPINFNQTMSSFDNQKINFFCFHKTGKYFVDYFMFGKIDDLIAIWSFENCNGPFPEYVLTEHIKTLKIKEINFVYDKITINNDIMWPKYNINLSEYYSLPDFSSSIAYE